HSVLAIQQGLHEPVHIQCDHLPKTTFVSIQIKHTVSFTNAFFIPVSYVCKRISVLQHIIADEFTAISGRLRPRESLLHADLRITVPWVAAEKLIRAFSR